MFDAPPPGMTADAEVVIVAVSERPAFMSGSFATFFMVLGRSADGDVDPFYIPYVEVDQAPPPLGGQCRLNYREGQVEVVGGSRVLPSLSGSVVSTFECDPAVEGGVEAVSRRDLELAE